MLVGVGMLELVSVGGGRGLANEKPGVQSSVTVFRTTRLKSESVILETKTYSERRCFTS